MLSSGTWRVGINLYPMIKRGRKLGHPMKLWTTPSLPATTSWSFLLSRGAFGGRCSSFPRCGRLCRNLGLGSRRCRICVFTASWSSRQLLPSLGRRFQRFWQFCQSSHTCPNTLVLSRFEIRAQNEVLSDWSVYKYKTYKWVRFYTSRGVVLIHSLDYVGGAWSATA